MRKISISKYSYQFRINYGHSMSKEKLSIILNDREKDVQLILERQQAQEKHYNELIAELKNEIASHKENIINRNFRFISVKNKNNTLEHELDLFARNLDNLKKDSNSYFQTIKMLENENNRIIKEKVI